MLVLYRTTNNNRKGAHLDVETLLAKARDQQLESVEIYSEIAHTLTLCFTGKSDAIHHCTRRGSALRGMRKGIAQHWTQDSVDASTSFPLDLFEHATTLLQSARSAFSIQNEQLSPPRVTATLSKRTYSVTRLSEETKQGTEETAELRAEWKVGNAPYFWERARASLAGLAQETAAPDGLAASVRASLTPTTRWPAPMGEVPILWSARAVGRLQLLFLQAFEGDRVLGGMSFLSELSLPVALRFTVVDRPPIQADHEGSTRKQMILFKKGKPTGLACNTRVAHELDVAPTGHARRASFDSPATIGFWHPHLEGDALSDGLLAQMDRGISVKDLEVEAFNPATGQVSLKLTRAYLVHQGCEGELMEPVRLSMPLLTILESFQNFERVSETTGIAVGKAHQKMFTELTAPAALSAPIPFPGSVPAGHYW